MLSLELGKALLEGIELNSVLQAQHAPLYPGRRCGDHGTQGVRQIAVGDIAVYRRGKSLFGHRIIAKGTRQEKIFIVTKPDRTERGDDGPTYEDDVLGVVRHIERKGKIIKPHMRQYSLPSRVYFAACLKAWEFQESIRLKAIPCLGLIQQSRLYRRAAQRWFAAICPAVTYSLRVPISSRQTHDLHCKLPLDKLDGLNNIDCFTLALLGKEDQTPAGTITLIFRPPGCPLSGWWVRISMRGFGTGGPASKSALYKAEEVFARWGVHELWVNSPQDSPGTVAFTILGFKEVGKPLPFNCHNGDAPVLELRPMRKRLRI